MPHEVRELHGRSEPVPNRSGAGPDGAGPMDGAVPSVPGPGDDVDPPCGFHFYWWDGEYEGECELPEGHDGDHWDGLSWASDDGECVDYRHDSP